MQASQNTLESLQVGTPVVITYVPHSSWHHDRSKSGKVSRLTKTRVAVEILCGDEKQEWVFSRVRTNSRRAGTCVGGSTILASDRWYLAEPEVAVVVA